MSKDEALAAFFGKLPSDNGKASAEQMLALLRGWTDSDFANAATGECCEDIKAMLEGAFSRVLDRLEALQAQPVGEAQGDCVVVRRDVISFLRGEGELDGQYYGDGTPPGEYRFWWRKYLAALTASPPVVEREEETFNGYSRATAERALARVHAWCAWSENEDAGEDTNPRMCSDDVRTALALVSTPVAQGDEVREALEGLRVIVPYLDWTISSESPGHHPTMPSAVATFKTALATLTKGARDAG